MLIRLCNHYVNNPRQIDKLICIKGLPDEFFFRAVNWEGIPGKSLIKPWEPDVERNIPQVIRHLCDPVEVAEYFPPIAKGEKPVIDRLKILGVRFDFMTEEGQLAWDKISDYIERSCPRDYRIPAPVLVAPTQQSVFDPHEARRNARKHIELRPAEVPVIDLNTMLVRTEPSLVTASQPVASIVVPSPVAPPVDIKSIVTPTKAEPEGFRCDLCDKTFDKQRALTMHKTVGHKKEKVGA